MRRIALALVACGLAAGCNDEASRLPDELRLRAPVERVVTSHLTGPGGLNHSLSVYNLSVPVVAAVDHAGLEYLNGLPSTQTRKTNALRETFYSTQKHWQPFKVWQATPIPKDDNWIRYSFGADPGPNPTLGDFVSNDNTDFLNSVDPSTLSDLHGVIAEPGSYYAYGGYRDGDVLIIAPKGRKAYFLHRD